MPNTTLEEKCVNTIRTLTIDAVQEAGSGHPGMPMGMADAAFVLWTKFLKHDPSHPQWHNRDRFVLSAGHGSMLLYSLLHLTGYDLSLEELKNYRQWGSLTPGHPEYGLTPGVETTTGPLGQGIGTAVGMAIAEAHLAASFNTSQFPVTDHYTYALISDGDLMEGISHEAASLAGHLQLGKLICLYDSNNISIEGNTNITFTENEEKRFEGYGWHVQKINGHDRNAVEEALQNAQEKTGKPSVIICKTHIAQGSPNKHDTAAAHGSALGEEEVRLTKENLGWDPDKKFYIPDEVLQHFRKAKENGKKWYQKWNNLWDDFAEAEPQKAEQLDRQIHRKFADKLSDDLPEFEVKEGGMATRNASNTVLNAIHKQLPSLIGGSADLAGSTKTILDGTGDFGPDDYVSKNMHFGVREHGMAAAVNGMALHKGVIPYGATFFVFSDYARPSIRIAALSEIPSIFVLTHDSIGLGGDGPTHQPVEHLASFRAMPNALTLRPADANEVSWAWKAAVEYQNGPSLIILTRQNVPIFDRNEVADASLTQKGAYILADSAKETPDVILIGTGSEVQLALEAQRKLEADGVHARVVSMPSWELFAEQDQAYQDEVLPPSVKARVSIEAAATLGWERWIGSEGTAIGVDKFGASAPFKKIYENYGITTDRVIEEANKLLA
ncbi:MAG TPA: transketolase [Balneolaceae bacterium]|nr:transketolase [Balneolaceae bacterium]